MTRERERDRGRRFSTAWSALCRRWRASCKAYAVVAFEAPEMLEALLWAFHNPKSGFPSYDKIAQAAGRARSSVAGALKALESCGILS